MTKSISVLSLKKRLKMHLKKKGLGAKEIESRLQAIDTNFLLHAFVNRMDRLETMEKRLVLYKRYLEQEVRNDKP